MHAMMMEPEIANLLAAVVASALVARRILAIRDHKPVVVVALFPE
jgi:hypothetical protein